MEYSNWQFRLAAFWGCLPPLQALVAMHGLWALVFVPPLVWAVRRRQPRTIHIAGWTLLGLGLIAIAGQCVHELLTWYAEVPEELRRYIWQRMAYAMACNTDLPAVQLVIVGVVLLVAARWRQ